MLHVGDALDIFKDVHGLASICADPPGGGSFMALKFDRAHGGRDGWIANMAPRFRVAREATERGAWGLFWSFPRTAHWTACALDDAGWEVVSCIEHVHGQGWPKGRSQLKPAKEIWWLVRWGGVTPLQIDRCRVRRSAPLQAHNGTDKGYGGKRPYTPGDAGKILQDAGSWPPDFLATHAPACREVGSRKVRGANNNNGRRWQTEDNMFGERAGSTAAPCYSPDGTETVPAWSCLAACTCGLASLSPAGGAPKRCPGCGEERWWACPVAELDGQSGELQTDKHKAGKEYAHGTVAKFYGGDRDAPSRRKAWEPNGAQGGASRFFPTFHYDAKASARERQAGCEGLLWVKDKAAPIGWRRATQEDMRGIADRTARGIEEGKPDKDHAVGNVHATIKGIGCGEEDGLMRWLVRLITPPGGRVGDPFLGSGSTAVAAQIEGHDFIGCDIDPGAVDIARARVAFWTPERHREELVGTIARREAAQKKAAEERERAVKSGQIALW